MEELRSLVKVMRVGEKRLLKHLLSRNSNGEENLRMRMFEFIDSHPGFKEEELRSKFIDNSSSAYSHLKRRLQEDILSVLLLKESSKRIAQANRAAQFECIKKLAQAYVLIFRGAKREGAEILNSARELAIRYELSAELVSIDHITREALYSFTDGRKLAEVNKSLRNQYERWGDILRSEELSFLITLPQLKEGLLESEEEGFEGKMIGELKSLYEKSGTARIGFWYYMADVENCLESGRFQEALDLGLKFLTLVEDNPAVKSKNNIAGVNQSLGFAYLNLRQYGEAIEHLNKSDKLFPATGFNRLQCLLFLVQAQSASSQLELANQTIDLVMAHPRIKARENLLPRWLYIKACVQFLEGQFSDSFRTMNSDGYLLRQQDEWNVQFRILEMILLVEMRDEEWLEFKLDATRKFLTRHKSLDTPRVRAAVDLLSNLLRKELDFEEISDKNRTLLKSCLDEEAGFEWNPAGQEFVRFDKWFESKLPEVNQEE